MTEDEAKTKVCCGPRNSSPMASDLDCIASACMAWRWIDSVDLDGASYLLTRIGPGNASWEITDDTSERRGFCGLAGGNVLPALEARRPS